MPYQALLLGDNWIVDAVDKLSVNKFKYKLISKI